MSDKIFMTSYSEPEMKQFLKEVLKEAEKERAEKTDLTKTFSINQTAKMLSVSFSTVKKLISAGTLKTTSDNRRVPARAIDEYLQDKQGNEKSR